MESTGNDPISIYIKNKFSEELKILINNFDTTTQLDPSKRVKFLNEFNETIFSDSFLNMDAIYKLSSSTELLILGACETNIGFKSTEGTINLGRAFTAIGVKSMLLSSWAIDEQSSIQIIRSFLKYLDQIQLNTLFQGLSCTHKL